MGALQTKNIVKFRYGLFFAGFREDRWYWEGVVALRKVAVVALGVFGPQLGVNFLAHWALLALGVASGLQLVGDPYESGIRERKLQVLEMSGLAVCWLTMWTANFFLHGEGDLMALTVMVITMHTAMAVAFLACIIQEQCRDTRLGKTLSRRWKCFRQSSTVLKRKASDGDGANEPDSAKRSSIELAPLAGRVGTGGGSKISKTAPSQDAAAELATGLANPLYKGKEAKKGERRSVTDDAAEAGEWTAIWSEEHSRFYYYNKASGVTTWEKPSGLGNKLGTGAA